MDQVLTTFIAVAGTLIGSLLGYQFQKRVADRSERRSAVLAFTAATNEFIRSQHDWWHRRHEEQDGPAHVAARTEAFRIRGQAFQAVHQLRLLVPDDDLHARAEQAIGMIGALHRATDREELRTKSVEARASLSSFVVHASAQIR
ncbi:hypothetical protein [Streptomyces tubercidicus]|uniref:hypothetical protein n=1 Tax=Streptomyces tubercidicus TaxID=47759 RepID=UPI002E1943E5|nr:hypothetical protein OG690_10945 [Streptomyces tubercidicus]